MTSIYLMKSDRKSSCFYISRNQLRTKKDPDAGMSAQSNYTPNSMKIILLKCLILKTTTARVTPPATPYDVENNIGKTLYFDCEEERLSLTFGFRSCLVAKPNIRTPSMNWTGKNSRVGYQDINKVSFDLS